MGRAEGGMAAAFHGLAGELQSGLDMVDGETRESGFDLNEGVPSFQKLQDIGDHDTAPLKTRLAMANRRINGDVIRQTDRSSSHNVQAIIAPFHRAFKVALFGGARTFTRAPNAQLFHNSQLFEHTPALAALDGLHRVHIASLGHI